MSIRAFLRLFVLTAGLGMASWLVSGAWSNYQKWLANRDDPSVAEYYGDGCWIDGSLAAGVLFLTFLVLWAGSAEHAGDVRKEDG